MERANKQDPDNSKDELLNFSTEGNRDRCLPDEKDAISNFQVTEEYKYMRVSETKRKLYQLKNVISIVG